eukprot:CAMPEP_0168568732 /NCGR_PEP_ID=MMETSP0413-20121227/15740_1 /TAXON_ID=136452 /ORGANISM="Filamoeba nolandi, Strain NC-AS-23-1" /LENGTH=988 /DNA_ID=CAMNT_0008601099 /DNA_START=9 /DNA_END=2975 /DNA_ORIENTATION=-
MNNRSLITLLVVCYFGATFCQITQNVTKQTTAAANMGPLVRDNQGNFINVGGLSSSTANFGGAQLTGPGAFALKLDENLNHVWSTQYVSTSTTTAVGIDSQNNIVLAGFWYGGVNLTLGGPILRSSGNYDFFFGKLSPLGTHIWSQKFNFSQPADLAIGSDDSIAVCGLFSGNTSLGGAVLQSINSNNDWFVAKYNSAGSHLWSFRLGGVSYDSANSIAVDSSGNYIVGGVYSGGGFVINGITLPAVANDIVIVKLDTNGTILWYKNFGSSGADSVNSVAFDLSGNVLLTGSAGGSIDLIQPHNGGNDIFVIKYSASGVFQWSKLMGSSGNDVGNDIQCGTSDSVYVTGIYTNNASVGGSALPTTTTGMFVAKYASDGSHIWSQGYTSTSNSSAGRQLVLDSPWSRVGYGFDFLGSINFGGITLVSTSQATVGYVLFTETGVAPSPSPTAVPSPSPSASSVPSQSPSITPSRSATPSISASPSASPSPTVCLPCATDSDCSNQGICSNATSPGYCSCFSGFGGCNCNIRPAPACEPLYEQITDLSALFKPNASMDYQGYNLYINVDAPLQETAIVNPAYGNSPNTYPYSLETLIYFGSTPQSYPNCTFPVRPVWSDLAATYPSCVDSYTTNLTWAYARTYCGFIAANNTKNYTSQITMSRRFINSNGKERTEQTARILNVVFPTEVTVTESFVTISFPSAGLAATITFVDYNPSDDRWVVHVATEVDASYYISNSSSVASVTSTLASLNRVPTLQVSPCTINGLTCSQTLTYTFPQGTAPDACLGLVGSVVTDINIGCAVGSCAPTNISQLALQLDTADSCPITDTIDFSIAALYSFRDAALAFDTTIFDNNDIAYFGADVQSTEAIIQSRSVKSGSVCFKNGTAPCVPVQYTTLTSTNGKDPVFSVNFADPANQAVFGGIVDPTAFTVKATIQVSFAGAKGLHVKNIPSSQTVDLSLSTYMQPDQSASTKMLPAFSLCIMLLAFILY